MPLFSILLMIALAVIWGASYLFIKILLVDMGPSALNAARCLIGAVVLWIAIWTRHVPLPRKAGIWAKLALVAVVGIVLPFSAIAWGTQHIASGMSAILVATMPIFTYLLVLILGDERVTVSRSIGLLIGFAGIIVLMLPQFGGEQTGAALWGQLAIVGASISYAVSILYVRRKLGDLPSILISAGQVTGALLCFVPLALIEGRLPTAMPGATAIFSLLVLGALGTGVAYLIYYRLLHDEGPTATSFVSYLTPPVSVFWGWAVLSERLHWTAFVAMAMVLAAMALVNVRPRQTPAGAMPVEVEA